MTTRNKNILYFLSPATYVPLALAGTFYAKADFSNPLYILYALLPLAVSAIISACAAVSCEKFAAKKFANNCTLARFAVLSFATYVACLCVASIITLAIRGRTDLPLILGAWTVLLTIFSVYLFCWLYAVYRIFYKDNPDFL